MGPKHLACLLRGVEWVCGWLDATDNLSIALQRYSKRRCERAKLLENGGDRCLRGGKLAHSALALPINATALKATVCCSRLQHAQAWRGVCMVAMYRMEPAPIRLHPQIDW
jgi:hypothetical protein